MNPILEAVSCPQCGTDYPHSEAHACPVCRFPCHEVPT